MAIKRISKKKKKKVHGRNILRRYEWDLLVFCKQTPFELAAIGTLRQDFLPLSIVSTA